MQKLQQTKKVSLFGLIYQKNKISKDFKRLLGAFFTFHIGMQIYNLNIHVKLAFTLLSLYLSEINPLYPHEADTLFFNLIS